jgi:methyl-accepting chemotaxis protein
MGLLHPTENQVAQNRPPLRTLPDLRLALNTHRRAQFEYIAARNEAERKSSETHLQEAYRTIRATQENYAAAVADPEHTLFLSQLHDDLGHYLAVSQQVIDLARADLTHTKPLRTGRSYARRRKALRNNRLKSEALAADLLFGPEEGTLTKALSFIQSIETHDLRSAEEARRATTSSEASLYASARRQTMIWIGITVGAGFVVALSTGFIVIRPIQRVLAAARRIAGGDLSEDIEAFESGDEAEEFARYINDMQGTMRRMIQGAINCSQRIVSASDAIFAATRQQTQSAGAQHEQTELVGAALRQIAVRAKDISEQSTCAVATSRHSAETLGKSEAAVDSMSLQVSAIASTVGHTSKSIGELERSSERIAQIVAVIDDLARENNSLLLNTSIEAARTTGKGRGFALLTDEATQLSERTSRAAKEIGLMVGQIQVGTKNAVAAMSKGTTQTENSAQATRLAGELLQTVILDSESINQTVARIAAIAEQQIGAIEQIVSSLDQISKVTFESSEHAQRSADAAEQLAEVVEELRNLATCFPVREKTANCERDLPAWSSEPARSLPAEAPDQNNGRTINGLSVAPRPSVNPGRARIHARLVTPEANSESQSRAPSPAS